MNQRKSLKELNLLDKLIREQSVSDREKNSLPSIDSCPFLWTAHRFLPIEQNRVTPDDTVWRFKPFPSSLFYERIYALETDSIIYSK